MTASTNNSELFCYLSSARIAELVRAARGSVCYASPGIQIEPATAMAEIARRIGPELLTVSLDFDERVMRMGYGDIAAVQVLRDAGIVINNAPGLRSALIIVDGEGYTFTPTPLYLEAESTSDVGRNALRLSPEQVAEALARLSPAAKAIATARTDDPEEKARIASLPVEVGAIQVDETQFKQVDENLKKAPPDALLGQSLSGMATEKGARQWLNSELDRVFPSAESLIQVMRLEERYKDVTFETLNRDDFLVSVKTAFPNVDWDKAYREFRAAGESSNGG